MSGREFNKFEKECPICGSVIWGKGQKVLLEGAKITVCQACAKHGQKIKSSHTSSQTKLSGDFRQKKPQQRVRRKVDGLMEMELVSDYTRKIRSARNANHLTQEQFAQKINEKPSLLRRIEAGKAEPTLKLAQKLEKHYKIKLLKRVDEVEVDTRKYMKKDKSSSLGDIAFIKKKK
jgi:putative transcription factor